jgi:hypothetical protein
MRRAFTVTVVWLPAYLCLSRRRSKIRALYGAAFGQGLICVQYLVDDANNHQELGDVGLWNADTLSLMVCKQTTAGHSGRQLMTQHLRDRLAVFVKVPCRLSSRHTVLQTSTAHTL